MIRALLRFAAVLVGVFFLALGLAFLFAPATATARFAIAATDAAGFGTVRGDLGALFLAIAIFTLAGLRKGAEHWLNVPLLALALVMLGRIAAFLFDGFAAPSAQALLIEVTAFAILAAARLTGDLKTRPVWIALAAAALVILAIAFIAQRQIGLAIFRRNIDTAMTRTVIDSMPDGLHAGLCGSGSPLPDPNRAGPCVFVIAGKRLYIVDAGEDSARKLGLMAIPPGQISAIFLTHFHSDHIGGLGEMMLQRWAGAGNSQPVEVYGPQGVESVVDGFNAAYKLDTGYRVAHHGAATVPPSGAGGVARPFEVASDNWSAVVLERDGLKVRAFSVRHTPVQPAVGYRFDYEGRSVVVSGDTAPSEYLEQIATGADILFHEGLQTSMVAILHDAAVRHDRSVLAKITGDIPSYHTTPEDAARIAARAGVRQLVLYHIIPALPIAYFQAAYLGDAPTIFRRPITVAKDGMLFSLPPSTNVITMKELL
jgi:ribonuclease Z